METFAGRSSRANGRRVRKRRDRSITGAGTRTSTAWGPLAGSGRVGETSAQCHAIETASGGWAGAFRPTRSGQELGTVGRPSTKAARGRTVFAWAHVGPAG